MIIFQQLPGLQLAAGRGRQVQLLWYDRHTNLALRCRLPRLNLTGQRGKKKGGERRGGMRTSRRVSTAGDANVQKTTERSPSAFRTEARTRLYPDLFLPSSWPDCKARFWLFRRSLPTCACSWGIAQAESRLSCFCFPVLADGGVGAIGSNVGRGVFLISRLLYIYFRVGEIQEKHPGLAEPADSPQRRYLHIIRIYFHALKTQMIHYLIKA